MDFDNFKDIFDDLFMDLVQGTFSGLERVSDINYPSFKGDGFWLETGVGPNSTGPRLKRTDWDDNLNEPLLYILGYHNFNNRDLREAKLDATNVKKYIKENLQIKESYFVASEVVEKFYDVDAPTGIRSTLHCFVLYKGRVRSLITGKKTTKNGLVISPYTYYGCKEKDYITQEPHYVQDIDFPIGVMVRKDEEITLKFLRENWILDS